MRLNTSKVSVQLSPIRTYIDTRSLEAVLSVIQSRHCYISNINGVATSDWSTGMYLNTILEGLPNESGHLKPWPVLIPSFHMPELKKPFGWHPES